MYEPVFSHEYLEAGPSGEPRSYWNIHKNGRNVMVNLCLAPRRDMALLTAQAICRALEDEFNRGRLAKAAQVREVLGIGK